MYGYCIVGVALFVPRGMAPQRDEFAALCINSVSLLEEAT